MAFPSEDPYFADVVVNVRVGVTVVFVIETETGIVAVVVIVLVVESEVLVVVDQDGSENLRNSDVKQIEVAVEGEFPELTVALPLGDCTCL